MTFPKLPLTGACRCGAVQVEITAVPVMTAACHCTGCQKMSASAFSLTAVIPAQGFAVTQGSTERGGAGKGPIDHQCCPQCMTWMFTRVQGMDDFVNVRPSLFDDTTWFVPFIETMTQEKIAWATVPARHSFDGFPEMQDYVALMAEFSI